MGQSPVYGAFAAQHQTLGGPMVEKLETLVFRFRGLILAVFAAFTL